MNDLKKFHEALSHYSPDKTLTCQEVGEAFYNLTGFMSLLLKINKREKIISLEKQQRGVDYE